MTLSFSASTPFQQLPVGNAPLATDCSIPAGQQDSPRSLVVECFKTAIYSVTCLDSCYYDLGLGSLVAVGLLRDIVWDSTNGPPLWGSADCTVRDYERGGNQDGATDKAEVWPVLILFQCWSCQAR